MSPVATDDDWLRAVRSGDPRAQAQLVETWLPTVLRWCTRLGGPKVDAEDAAHDVMLVALRRIDLVWDDRRLGPWLFGITRRTLAQHRRRAWVRRWVPGATVEATDAAPGPARLVAVSRTGALVQQILDELADSEREVLLLCLLEDRPDREVAEMLAIPVGTVKSRLRRARLHFLARAKAVGLDSWRVT
jgi:RNA polymerase sigma-70 factor (ECF subfamily)